MAIGTPVAFNANGTTSATTASITVAVGDVLIAVVGGRRNGAIPAQPTISDTGGGTWEPIADVSIDEGVNPRVRVRFFGQYVTSAGTITVTGAISDGTTTGVTVMQTTGAANDFTNFATATNLVGDPAPALGSITSGSAIFGLGFFNANNIVSPQSGYLELTDYAVGTTMRSAAQYDLSSPGLTAGWTSTNTYSVAMAIEIKEASTGRTGTLSSTIDAITLSSTGTVLITGTASPTVGAVTLAATGTVLIQGTLSQAIGDITLSATGQGSFSGTLSANIGDVTLSATGTLLIAGTLSQSIGAVTLASTGTLPIVGTLSQNVGAVTLASTGALAITGTLSQSIGDVTLTASSLLVSPGSGVLVSSIGDITLSATGELDIAGTLSASVGEVTLSATGELLALLISGELDASIGEILLTAEGEDPNAVRGGGGGRKRRGKRIRLQRPLRERMLYGEQVDTRQPVEAPVARVLAPDTSLLDRLRRYDAEIGELQQVNETVRRVTEANAQIAEQRRQAARVKRAEERERMIRMREEEDEATFLMMMF